MRLKFKEDPREWRKSVLLTCLGLALLATFIGWERGLAVTAWLAALGVLALIAAASLLQPRWFRGYYRLSMRVGVALSYVVARVVLALIFVVVVTPLGLLLRLAGKDLLGLKRHPEKETYWTESRAAEGLDKMF